MVGTCTEEKKRTTVSTDYTSSPSIQLGFVRLGVCKTVSLVFLCTLLSPFLNPDLGRRDWVAIGIMYPLLCSPCQPSKVGQLSSRSFAVLGAVLFSGLQGALGRLYKLCCHCINYNGQTPFTYFIYDLIYLKCLICL